jgi:hypothetical protein
MFSEITPRMLERMAFLEDLDKKDRDDGTPRMQRLRQIPPETGKFIALLASNCPPGQLVEIGTSAGYSTMWLSLAAKERNIKVKTFELLEEKIRTSRMLLSLLKATLCLISGGPRMWPFVFWTVRRRCTNPAGRSCRIKSYRAVCWLRIMPSTIIKPSSL